MFVAHRSAYPRDVHDLDRRCLQHVVEAMTVGWHPDLRRVLAESDPDSVMLVQHQASVPVPAWQSTNVTLVGDSLHSMPPVGDLGGNAALRDANRAWFRACHAVPSLKRLNLAYRAQARPRPWERVNETRLSM